MAPGYIETSFSFGGGQEKFCPPYGYPDYLLLHKQEGRNMDIEINNCNNIEHGNVSIKENSLNIKHAINGTGKSTIAKAILASISDREQGTKQLLELTPFKHLEKNTANPEITGTENIKNIRIFDERYINDFVFQADELVKGSFDIFIRDEDYEKGMREIDTLTKTMQDMLAKDKDIEVLINDFNEISSTFGKPIKTGIHASSTIAKAFKDGNKVNTIPPGLEDFKDFIQHTDNFKWIKWQQDGKNYLEISADCPFCTHDIKDKKDTILKVSETYDHKSIENLNKIVAVFQRLNKYFADTTNKEIEKFLKNVDGYSDDQVSYLMEVKSQIDRLSSNFSKVQSLGFTSLKDVGKVIEELKKYQINLGLFNHLNSPGTKEKVDIVNNAINEMLQKAGDLQGSITKQKILIERLVKKNSGGINGFLKNAGYSYSVKLIEDEKSNYRLKLIHNDANSEVGNAKTHLSFGERNAFSLVLFMYDALKSDPDLIILDDPISSFDKNKKYAIIEMLFRKKPSFRGRTVLLLSHDFEPIVDMVLHHSDRFEKPHATFLENKHGKLSEKEVTREDIKTFIEINLENSKLDLHDINRLVYLRRHQEITNNKSFSFDVISNLFHKRDIPTKRDGEQMIPMTNEEITTGTAEIKNHIPTFDYTTLLTFIRNEKQMKALYGKTQNNYEKLHIYRMTFDDKEDDIESDIIRKFINEAFHIENNYIYQLNPCHYQLVPQYVIDECDKYMAGLP